VSIAADGYEYRVERDVDGPGRADIKLVRYELRHRLLGARHGKHGIVLFHRVFKPLLEPGLLEGYASVLQQLAEHVGKGTFGCFVATQSREGNVEIKLYERWFDGLKLHCDELASRTFDASDDGALVASAEFRGELEQWTEDQNAAREQIYMDAAADDLARTERAIERASAADGLAAILARSAPQQ
jgi:hypothetical protein